MAKIGNLEVALADPFPIRPLNQFIGRKQEIDLCLAAWNLRPDGSPLLSQNVSPLHFRLEGRPGVGKNEIVYELARQLKRPLYVIQGHEELTPEDLSLMLVPDPSGTFRDAALMLRASPLATAIMVGGLFFFDEINRVPDRSLSPLASVLDRRGTIYSALAGIHIGAQNPNPDVPSSFRFCCALNPALRDAGRGVLPEYIEERTLPAINIGPLKFTELQEMIGTDLKPPAEFMQAFKQLYGDESRKEISARQALTLMRYAMSIASSHSVPASEAVAKAEPMIFSQKKGDTHADGADASNTGDNDYPIN
jgi:hypothetical protein